MNNKNPFAKINSINESKVNNLSDNLYNKELEWLMNKIIETCENKSGNSSSDKIEKTFSIVGERGTGKTSSLFTLKNILEDKGFIVFDVIDPNIHGDDLFIVELVISSIYNYLSNLTNELEYEQLIQKSIKTLEVITKALSSIHISQGKSRAYFVSESLNSEVLKDIASRTQIEKLFKELFKLLDDIGRQRMIAFKGYVVLIDDVDLLSNNKVFKMLEHIWKFISRNLITVISYRSDQLYNSILEQKIEENRTLIEYDKHSSEKSISSAELNLQTAKYLEKVVPLNNRIQLLHGDKLLETKYSKIIKSMQLGSQNEFQKVLFECYDMGENVTTKEWLLKALEIKVGLKLKPVDSRENIDVLLPNNLRGILQLSDFIHNRLKNVDKNSIDYIDETKNNLSQFEQYICNNIVKELGYEYSELINSWIEKPIESKNNFIYSHLFLNFVKPNLEDVTHSPYFNQILSFNVENYNYSISDIFVIIELLKSINTRNSNVSRFIYIVKVLYSILLLKLYLDALQNHKDINNNSLNDYLTLLNAQILPDIIFKVGSNTLTLKYNEQLTDEEVVDMGMKDNKEYVNYLSLFVKNFFYTSSPLKGFKTIYSRAKSDTLSLSNRQFFHYRFYEYGDDIKPMNNRIYTYNPITMFSKKDYILRTFENDDLYVVYSMFDLDVFTRINLSRQSQDKPFKYLLEQIKNVLNGNVDGRMKEYSEKLSNNIRNESKVYKFNFSENEKENREIFEMFGSIADVLQFSDDNNVSENNILKTDALNFLDDIIENAEDADIILKGKLFKEHLSKPNFRVTKEIKDFINVNKEN